MAGQQGGEPTNYIARLSEWADAHLTLIRVRRGDGSEEGVCEGGLAIFLRLGGGDAGTRGSPPARSPSLPAANGAAVLLRGLR